MKYQINDDNPRWIPTSVETVIGFEIRDEKRDQLRAIRVFESVSRLDKAFDVELRDASGLI